MMVDTLSVFAFQFRCSFTIRPRKLKSFTFSMRVSSIFSEIEAIFCLGLRNIMFLVVVFLLFFIFSDNLFSFSNSLILISSPFMLSLSMYVCICVCVYVCMCMCLCMHICVYLCACMVVYVVANQCAAKKAIIFHSIPPVINSNSFHFPFSLLAILDLAQKI